MAKDPAFLFYSQDFLIGSSLLTPLQKGHYITLLCYQHQSATGSLSLDVIKSLMRGDFKNQWPAISKKFSEDENGFFNERMRKEVDRRSKYSDSRRKNRSVSYDKDMITYDKDMALELSTHMSGHMETATLNIETKGNSEILNGTVTSDAEKSVLENQIEFERICMVTGKNRKEATVSLHKFHLYLEEKEQYPKSRKAVFAGFEKWLMNERKQPDQKHEKKENSGASLRKLTS